MAACLYLPLCFAVVAAAATATAEEWEACGAAECDDVHTVGIDDVTSLLQSTKRLPKRRVPLIEHLDVLSDTLEKPVHWPGYRISFEYGQDQLAVEVMHAKGGLLQSFSLNGESIVLNRPYPDQMDGSQFWPSPQSAESWGSVWPPPPQLDPVPSMSNGVSADANPYEATVDESAGTVKLSSVVVDKMDVQVNKTFSADVAQGAVLIDYELRNAATSTKSWAPWQITRVAPGGLTFFATGKGAIRWANPKKTFTVSDIDGITWYQHDAAEPGGQKLISDTSSNFLAHTDGKKLLVECFQHIAANEAAPNEGQVEIYNGGDYVEVEPQGRYQSLEPGAVLKWRVTWFLRKLPSEAKAIVGDKTLADYAASLCSPTVSYPTTA